MDATLEPYVALVALFLVIGLWTYERWGLRLGGVLVLPFLIV